MQAASKQPFTDLVDHSFCDQNFPDPSVPPADYAVIEPILDSKDLKKIKKCLRVNHWPPNHPARAKLWQRLCALHTNERTSIYNETVNEVFGSGEQSHDVSLPPFVDPTAMVHYHLNPQGVFTAKRIMCVLGTTNPDIIYAPTIFSLTSAFLHYLPEEAAYNAVYSLVTSNKGFINQTKVAYSTTEFVLKDLAQRYSKTWFNQTSKDNPELENVLSRWVWWILEFMPFTHMVRVLDCYFVEGPKVLYRVALAVLNLFSKHSSSGRSPRKGAGDMAAALAQFCEDMPVAPEKLLKAAFSIRGLSRKEIRKLTVKNEMYVKSMKHTVSHQKLPKSASCESLALKVSRSFSGPMALEADSGLLAANELDSRKLVRTRSRSHGEVLPFSNVSCTLITVADWQVIWRWLPTRMTLYQPRLVYTTAEHGTSIKTFYNCVDEVEPTLLVMKTAKNEILGAYCSTDWAERKKVEKKNLQYFGTGETFLFTLAPKRVKYEWVGKKMKENTPHSAHLFMAGDNTKFTIGGGGGEGLQLDENMDKGRSDKCDTFGNPPLTEKRDFQCVAVEVFGFFQ